MKILDTPRSGSVAGTTASRNRFGQYYRTRAIPVQPRTPKQTRQRSTYTAGSSNWRTLSDAQRTAWNVYASQLTRSGSLGSTYSPTGASLYTGATTLNQAVGLTDPPTALPTYVLGITGIIYVDSTPGPEALNVSIDTTSTDNTILIQTSGPVSPGITSSAAVRTWNSLPQTSANLFARQFSMATSPVDIITSYKLLFPSPIVGQAIWFRFQEIFLEPLGGPGITNKLWITYRLVVA